MLTLPWTTRSLALVDQDLYIVDAGAGPFRSSVVERGRIRSFARLERSEMIAAIGASPPPRGSRLCFVIGTAHLNSRRIAIDARTWAGAAGELRASVEKLLPIEREHALLGLVDADPHAATADTGSPSGGQGYLLGADERDIAPVLDAIESAYGRRVDVVLGSAQALLGLGLRHAERVRVLDRGAMGVPTHHELRRGRVVRFGDAGHAGSAGRDGVLTMGGDGGEGDDRAGVVSGHDLAAGGAFAEVAFPRGIVPMRGRRRRSLDRWAVGGVAAVLGLVMLFGGGWLNGQRVARELARVDGELGSLAPALAEVEARRSRALVLAGVLGEIDSAWEDDPAVLEGYLALRDAALGDDPGGFFYRVTIEPARVSFEGESESSASVLERVEGSSAFAGAELRPRGAVAERPGMESMQGSARRVVGSGAEGRGGG